MFEGSGYGDGNGSVELLWHLSRKMEVLTITADFKSTRKAYKTIKQLF